MLSFVFLGYGAAHFALWLWGWSLWSRRGRPISLLLALVTATLFSYDNLRIGVGRFIGPGETLHALSVPVFIWHATMLPLWVIAAGALARQADLQWARPRIVMSLFCLAAAALSAMALPQLLHLDLQVAYLADTVRYTTAHAGPQAALGAIVVNTVLLAVGIALWIRRSFPWLAVGAIWMLVAAGAFAHSRWSLPVSNLGELSLAAALILACSHFVRTDRNT